MATAWIVEEEDRIRLAPNPMRLPASSREMRFNLEARQQTTNDTVERGTKKAHGVARGAAHSRRRKASAFRSTTPSSTHRPSRVLKVDAVMLEEGTGSPRPQV